MLFFVRDVYFKGIIKEQEAGFMIVTGLKGKVECKVVMENTAMRVGSGSVPVFATPMLVALMENAAINALAGKLSKGQVTVGTVVEVKHLAATPIGMVVRAEAELTMVEGARLTFRVEAYDQKEKVGEGTHQRYILDEARFLTKVEAKAQEFSS
jgi:fluoroacetyl-CoA thioesterase